MKIIYTTTEAQPYNFRKLGAVVETENNETVVELSQAAYERFCEETKGTGHTHRLWRANHAFTRK